MRKFTVYPKSVMASSVEAKNALSKYDSMYLIKRESGHFLLILS